MFPTYMLAMTPQNMSGCWVINNGPALTPWIINEPRRIPMIGFGGMPRASMGTKAPPAAALLAVSGPATPAMAPFPNSSGCFGKLFLYRIRKKGGHNCASSGQYAAEKSNERTSRDRSCRLLPVLAVREDVLYLCLQNASRNETLKTGKDFGDTEKTHGHRYKSHAVEERGKAKVETGHPGNGVHTHGSQDKAEEYHQNCVENRSPRQIGQYGHTEKHEGEKLRRTEF